MHTYDDENRREYYVYRWFFKSTNETFYIGKGIKDRYKSLYRRNQYFIRIYEKYKDDIDVEKIKTGLNDREACELEIEKIAYYWSIGECKCNFNSGGYGGICRGCSNPEEKSRKLSAWASTRTGAKNPMYGKTHTPEAIAKIRASNVGRKLTPEHAAKLKKVNHERIRTEEERKKLGDSRRGKKLKDEHVDKMLKSISSWRYEVYFNDELVFSCYGHTALWKFCKEQYNITRRIIDKIINNSWTPKFNKHMHLKTLSIKKIANEDLKSEFFKKYHNSSVSTNRDECNDVSKKS